MLDTEQQAPEPCRSRPALASWLALSLTPGVGPVLGARLLAAFDGPQQVFEAGYHALRAHLPPSLARLLAAPPAAPLAAQVEAALGWLERPGRHLLTRSDAGYPPALLALHDPPLLLYCIGKRELLAQPMLAMVGSRQASAQGRLNADTFAAALSSVGLTIVSGLARGIDAHAHRGALAGPGSTVAVMGTGADRVYPSEHRALAARIAQEGCIVSEYPLTTAPRAENFPRRNRLISGMARGVLVVEAAAKSGSLITARMALEQGREVMAIPGSIHSALNKGCHQLIKQGAALVENACDVLLALNWRGAQASAVTPATPATPAPAASALLAAIGHDPVHVDTLAAVTGCAAGWLSSELLGLELDGHIVRVGGGWVQRAVPAAPQRAPP